jgi:hypothetical protein
LTVAITEAVHLTIHRQPVAQSTFLCRRASNAEPWRIVVLPNVRDGASGCIVVIEEGKPATSRLRHWLAGYYGASGTEISIAEKLLLASVAQSASTPCASRSAACWARPACAV